MIVQPADGENSRQFFFGEQVDGFFTAFGVMKGGDVACRLMKHQVNFFLLQNQRLTVNLDSVFSGDCFAAQFFYYLAVDGYPALADDLLAKTAGAKTCSG